MLVKNRILLDILCKETAEYFGTIHVIIEITRNKNIFRGFLSWKDFIDPSNSKLFSINDIPFLYVNYFRNFIFLKGLYGAQYYCKDFRFFFTTFSHYYEETYIERKEIYNYFYNNVLVELTQKTYALEKILIFLGYTSRNFEINLIYLIFSFIQSNLRQADINFIIKYIRFSFK